MADEPVVAVEPVIEPVTPAVEPVVAPVVETQFFGTDGILNEGWQGTLGEDIREEKSLLSFKTVGDLAKSFVNTKRMVGANVIAIPTDISTEGEWQEYHKAGGRPETVADYNLKVPEGIDETVAAIVFPEGALAKWQDRFFKGGLSQKAANSFIADFASDMLAELQTREQNKKLELEELVSGLSTEWGAAMEQNKHLGNVAVEEGTLGDQDFKDRLTKKFGNDPDFVRFSSNLGKMFAEGKPPGFAIVPTPSDLQDQIDKLMEDPLYTKGTQPQRMKIAEKIMAIRTLMKPEPVNT